MANTLSHNPSWARCNNDAPRGKSRQFGVFARGLAGPVARCAVVYSGLLIAACGGSPAPVPQATPYADSGFVETADHRMHYALTMTRDLPSEIAGSYGIVQRRNLALLTIALMPREPRGGARLAALEIEATALALTGERKALVLARHEDAGGPTYLAPVEVHHRVPITIEIRARATTESPEISARLTREFRLD